MNIKGQNESIATMNLNITHNISLNGVKYFYLLLTKKLPNL